MAGLVDHAPLLAAMLVLVAASGFFSASEAALFFLGRRARYAFRTGSQPQRIAAALLDDPERLLGAVLFWNLVVNIAYFALASIIGVRLQGPAVGVFSFAAVLTLIVFSEMAPKALAVLRPAAVAAAVSVPLAAAVRLVDPLIPLLRTVNLLSRRLLWPSFAPEPYLELADLERAVELVADETQREQERTALGNLVLLSDVRVEEVMRPRTHLVSFRPPVRREDLLERLPADGFLLVTEPDSDELAAAAPLAALYHLPEDHLERLAEDVIYVPWTATVSAALDLMRQSEREVAAVVNEYGETIGVVTYDDVLHSIFSESPSRFTRMYARAPLREVRPGVWQVSGMISLRNLARALQCALPESRSVTLAGALQEQLERFPRPGDAGTWGELRFEVVEVGDQEQAVVQLSQAAAEEAS